MKNKKQLKRKLCFLCLASFSLMSIPGTATAIDIDGQKSPHGVESIQQKKTKIIGIVTDSNTGEPIIGATVKSKHGSTGVITNMDGRFEIVASPSDILVFSYIGYTSKEIKVGDQKLMTVTLSNEVQQLNEVVVTAFGTGQKKESVVGSIQQVRPAELVVPTANLSNAFAGRLAGVIAYQRSGLPGSNDSDFYIRGISTLSGINSPLIVLDGVEISSSELDAIDPDIIESFSILKDATATAMYGTRGANGVMIITTKTGLDVNKPKISFRVEGNVTTPTKLAKFVDGPTYMRMFNEAVTNQQTGHTLYTEEDIANTANGVNPLIWPNVDWYKEIFNNQAFNQKANFNIRGGTSKLTYFMNLSVNHETAMLKNRSKDFYSYDNSIDRMRYSFQNNIDFKMSKSSKIALHLNVKLIDASGPNSSVGSIYSQVMNNNPVAFPVYFPGGDQQWVRWGSNPPSTGGGTNPVSVLTNGFYNSFESTVNVNVNFEQKLDFITKGLRFKTMVSFKNWNKTSISRSQNSNFYYLEGYGQKEDGTYDMTITPFDKNYTKPIMGYSSSDTGNRMWYFQAFVDYNRTFNKHHVSGMLLANLQSNQSNSPGSLIESLPKRKIGYALRATYDYDHRYMLEFNAGYNGSENFAKGHRFGLFPSVALGWNVSEEHFWEPMKNAISKLKFKASYGKVGNDQIGGARFIYMPIVDLNGTGSYPIGIPGATQNWGGGIKYKRFKNENITWEIGKKLNVGVEMQLFNSLNVNVDAFREIRSNIFQNRGTIPNYLGASGITLYGNLAKVKNWGVDIAIDYGKRFTKDFAMQFKGTFTFARNRVIEYDEAPNTRPEYSYIGHSVNTLYGYISNGLYVDEEDIKNNPTSTLGNIAIAPGDIKYVDQPDAEGKYDNQITQNDRCAMGHPTVPEIVYGFGPSISYKNWDFSFFFQGAANTSLMMGGIQPFGHSVKRGVLKYIAEDYWSKDNPNPNATFPRLTHDENNHNWQPSTHWLRNAAFLKLKNVELGYQFKKGPRVYLSGVNLLTFSPFKLWDPERGGGSGLSYPTTRTFSIGVQMTFNK